MNDRFNKIHPIAGLMFFAFTIGFSMFLMQPVCLVISLICAFLNAAVINGKRAVLFTIKYIIPMILLVLIINPVFNHRGSTILMYFPWNNPLTLESVIYGGAAAVMLASVMLWFSVFNTVMTSDKIIYLFGRIIPSLSLIISMTLRFVPRFTAQFRKVRAAQRTFEVCDNKNGFLRKLKRLIDAFSVMISWSLENAVETADSMKSRGYGLKGRTAYSIFSFKKQDFILLGVITVSAAVLIVLLCLGTINFTYFPSIKCDYNGFSSVIFYILYSAVMLIPMIINVGEGLKWKRSRSVI